MTDKIPGRCRPAAAWVAMLAIAWIAGCESTAPNSGLPIVQMQLGNKTFTLEVADTSETQERGLMRRDSMPPDHGMIFVFAQARPLTFYMKNTRIPLDIVFIDSGQKVISIRQMKPYDLTLTPSGGPARWAIELNQNAAANAGLKVGDQLKIPPAAQHARP